MSMPEIKHGNTKRREAITDIIESVALEQAALSHILNAEGEKIQKVVNSKPRTDDTVENPPVDTEKLLEVNKSVRDTIDAVTRLCNSKIKVDTWKTTMYLPFYYAKI